MKWLKIVVLLTLMGITACSISIESISSNTRAHSMGMKQSVVTHKKGTLSLHAEMSDISYIDEISQIELSSPSWEENHDIYLASKPIKIKKYKNTFGGEFAVTDKLTVVGNYSNGNLEGSIKINDDNSKDTFADDEDEIEYKETDFTSVMAGFKYKIRDNRDSFSLSSYGSFEILSFDTPNPDFESLGHELTAGLITGYQTSDTDFFIPSFSLFYLGNYNNMKTKYGNLAKTSIINNLGGEFNVLLQSKILYLLGGVGVQYRLGEGESNLSQGVYTFLRIGAYLFNTDYQ